MNSSITHCIACGSDKLEKKKGGFSVALRGVAAIVPRIEYYLCTRCGETFLDLDNEQKLDRYLSARKTRPPVRKRTRAGRVPSAR